MFQCKCNKLENASKWKIPNATHWILNEQNQRDREKERKRERDKSGSSSRQLHNGPNEGLRENENEKMGSSKFYQTILKLTFMIEILGTHSYCIAVDIIHHAHQDTHTHTQTNVQT